ncbi:hypothetical protein [Sorangium sp. So ce1078]|uniref:hypothetical protein n=1 Tax=Sorangium sp. So ce1078 TaxID=3133329 RepID=UPI003F5DFABF
MPMIPRTHLGKNGPLVGALGLGCGEPDGLLLTRDGIFAGLAEWGGHGDSWGEREDPRDTAGYLDDAARGSL